ncbi:MAG: 2-oxoglutarate and iron-dependent oxygenase domain-containing protein [Hyphomicrobiaceae bacterium]
MNKHLHAPRIGIITLSASDPTARHAVARDIDEISRGPGFFYASGHGVDVDRLIEMTAKMRLTLPAQEKHNIAIKAYKSF